MLVEQGLTSHQTHQVISGTRLKVVGFPW